MPNPIADLSYRHYDGPLNPPNLRWWAIARMMIRLGFKNKWTWIFSVVSAWYYLAMIFILFIVEAIGAQRPPNAPNPMDQWFGNIVWKDQFLHGFSFGQILFMAVCLILGAGAIANDNRANALLVYLSKPVSKKDYLLGKWFGVFLPLLLMMAIPSAVFYLYGVMTFRDRGFLTQDPWLILRLLVAFPLGAAFHASLIVGISSLFNQGRVAGAVYAGLYFMTNFFTVAMSITFQVMMASERRGDREIPASALNLVQSAFYASIDGLNIGMAKAVLGTDGSPIFGLPARGVNFVPAPALGPTLLVMGLVSALMLLIAWRRIRAVEVVG